jgi:gamma-glutamylcyclotransferase
MATFAYFAYGSNMLTERLRQRCPTAVPVGTARVTGYAIAFHKRSNRDASGKATLHPAPEAMVHGVLFAIDDADRDALDAAEGVGNGYARLDDFAVTRDGATRTVTTYIATDSHIDADLTPFDWYRALIVAGARQHALPTDYVARLDEVRAVSDDDAARVGAAAALLRQAGFADLADAIATGRPREAPPQVFI